jgi:hypothetical protein
MRPNVILEQDEQKKRANRKGLKRFIRIIVCLLLVTALVILAMLLFFAVNLHHKPDLDELLTRARLAKLPESIKNLQVETRPYIDDDIGRAAPNHGELFVRFEAEPYDIDNFINNSPGIDKNIVRSVGSLPESEEVPTWWPTDDSSGLMYVFGQADIEGMVRVYDDSNGVRIGAWYIVNPKLEDIKNFTERIYNDPDTFLVDLLEDLYHEVWDFFEDLLRD